MYIILIPILALTILYILTVIVSFFMRVPYVPTDKNAIEKILEEARFKKGDTFLDLGCGDGRMVIRADKLKNINAIGYEIAPLIYIFAFIRKILTNSKAKIKFKNFFKENLKDADVIFCYLMPGALKKLEGKIIRECKKGTRIISSTFEIPGLQHVKIIEKNNTKKIPKIYIYKI